MLLDRENLWKKEIYYVDHDQDRTCKIIDMAQTREHGTSFMVLYSPQSQSESEPEMVSSEIVSKILENRK